MGHRMINRMNLRGVANLHGWDFQGHMGNRDKELRYFNNTYLVPYLKDPPHDSISAPDKKSLLEKLQNLSSPLPCNSSVYLSPKFREDGDHLLAAYNDVQRSIVFNSSNFTDL